MRRAQKQHPKFYCDRSELYIVLAIFVVLVCYLSLVSIAQKASFESYQAGYADAKAKYYLNSYDVHQGEPYIGD